MTVSDVEGPCGRIVSVMEERIKKRKVVAGSKNIVAGEFVFGTCLSKGQSTHRYGEDKRETKSLIQELHH